MKSVFVRGGAGFIGSHLVERLLRMPTVESVAVYDNFSSGTPEHLSSVRHDRRLRIVEADIKDLATLTASMKGADTVVHLAANPDIALAVRKPDVDFWEGTYLTNNVVEAVRAARVPKLIYASGSGVYGEHPGIHFPETYGPCLPISTYAASKIACEALICAYCHMFDMSAVVFRFANVVGAGQTHGVGYDFVRRLRADPASLRILGDGAQAKSYIHVADVLDAVLLAIDRCTDRYAVFNVATADTITVREIAELAIRACDLSLQAVRLDFTGGDRGWRGDVPSVRFDCAKIKSLGWSARYDSATAAYLSMRAIHEALGRR